MIFTEEFRLCSSQSSSSALRESELSWILSVQNTSKPTQQPEQLVGYVEPIPLTRIQELNKDSVLNRLNARNCFDFELDAGRMYHLKLRLPEGMPWNHGEWCRWLHFVRGAGGAWAFLLSDTFAPWALQMQPAARGALEVACSSGNFQRVQVCSMCGLSEIKRRSNSHDCPFFWPPLLKGMSAIMLLTVRLRPALPALPALTLLKSPAATSLRVEVAPSSAFSRAHALRVACDVRG